MAGIRVGIIGFGTIGRRVTEAVRAGQAGPVEVRSVLVRDLSKAPQMEGVGFTSDAPAFLRSDLDVVLEACGREGLLQHGEAVLAAGRHLMVVSVGALVDPEFFGRLRAAAERSGCRVMVPSGAIAALDALSAASLGPLDRVVHTVRKPLAAFRADQLGAAVGSPTPVVLFEGPIREGALRFPENVNVAAAVALASGSVERMILRVVADPGVERNTHEVEAQGWFGRLRLTMENVPTENPKTGRIVALSVTKALRSLVDPVVIGC